jgi:CRP/FNR family transcriptional regulator, cyclic AMP receptor protein
MSLNNRQQFLFIFLGEFNNSDLEWIVRKSKKESLHSGIILIHEGRKIDALYIVLSGLLSVFISSEDGDKELARISSGEIVGEISFIDDRPPLATVKAIAETEVLAISRMNLTKKLQEDLGFASRFYHGISLCLSDRMRGTVRLLGYGDDTQIKEAQNHPDWEENALINPSVVDNMKLAKAKFNWLVQSLSSSKF